MKEKKPLLIVKPGTVTKADITRAERMCGICIIESTEPENNRFAAAPPPDATANAFGALAVLAYITKQPGGYSREGLLRIFTEAALNAPQQTDTV